MMPPNEHALYVELSRLIEAMPNLYDLGWPPKPELHRWLGP